MRSFVRKQAPPRPIWPLIVSALILGSLLTVLTAGFRALYDYRQITGAEVPLSLDMLHYFTRESLQRQWQKLVTPPLTEHELPRFQLYADEYSLSRLDERLPMSGKQQTVSGHMVVAWPDGDAASRFTSEVEFRYRGGLPMHWLYEKKSFRVGLPDFTTLDGEQSFNLVIPSTLHTVTDWISYDMSRALGILAPEYYPVEVAVNDKTNGLHFYLSRIDESFLRDNRRMPGSIYSGDTLNVQDPFGSGGSRHEITLLRPDGVSLLWYDARLWSKDSARNAQQAEDRADIDRFIAIVNEPDPLRFYNDFDTFFAREVYFDFLALDTLLGNFHHDFYHNHKIYFDPYKGRFEPIQWDLRFWSNVRAKDIVEYPLLKQIIDNPLLEFERDRALYRLLGRFPQDTVEQMIRKAAGQLEPVLASDPLRSAPVPFAYANSSQKSAPYSMAEFRMAIEELVRVYQYRHDMLGRVLAYGKAAFDLRETGARRAELRVSVDGNSPFEFDPYRLAGDAPGLRVYRLHRGELTPVARGSREILYPGRKTLPGNSLGNSAAWAVKTFGNSRSAFSPLHYAYVYENLEDTGLLALDAIDGRNAVTGETLRAVRETALPDSADTVSVHPWDLSQWAERETTPVSLSGLVEIREDRVYDRFTPVSIAPGTQISLCPDCSIFFYGGVSALGTEAQPIRFRRLVDDRAWGSVVIHGPHGSGSRLRHVDFDGGSLTSRNLVHYPGMVNIHDVESFSLAHCSLRNNSIGDDALHIAYSRGRVSDCRFENAAFDAVDIDIAEVDFIDSTFVDSGNDGLDLMTSRATIDNVLIHNAGDKCISIGEASTTRVRNSRLGQCVIGVAIKDGSSATLTDVEFDGFSEAGIALYQKNTRYGRGGTLDGDRIRGLTAQDIDVGSKSHNRLEADALIGSQAQ